VNVWCHNFYFFLGYTAKYKKNTKTQEEFLTDKKLITINERGICASPLIKTMWIFPYKSSNQSIQKP